MTHPAFQTLLGEARSAHAVHPELAAFAPFPDDVADSAFTPHHIPAATLMAQDTGLFSAQWQSFRDAFVTAGPHAHWRETYKGTDIGQRFLDQFGCYSLVGPDAPYTSEKLYAFVVYMPAGLYYPWHHHPAEEIYLILAGEAEFMRKGEPSEVLQAGDTSFHKSNQPHAMQTHDHPVLAYVTWRNHLNIRPVLSAPGDLP